MGRELMRLSSTCSLPSSYSLFTAIARTRYGHLTFYTHGELLLQDELTHYRCLFKALCFTTLVLTLTDGISFVVEVSMVAVLAKTLTTDHDVSWTAMRRSRKSQHRGSDSLPTSPPRQAGSTCLQPETSTALQVLKQGWREIPRLERRC